MSEPLLEYASFTTPETLQASPTQGDPAVAQLTIVVSNTKSKVVNCHSISFSFLEGTLAKDFFSDATGIGTTKPDGWDVSHDGSLFTAKPVNATSGNIGSEGLAFVFSNIKVNQQIGTTYLTITEVTDAGTAEKLIPLEKFPPQFHLSEISLDPIPPIAGGDNITLSWTGSSDASYQIQYEDADDNTVIINHVKGDPNTPLPSTGSYTVESLMKDQIEFYLIAEVPVPGADTPLKMLRTATVAVELTPVEIKSFKVTPDLIIAEPGTFAVTLTWETVAATKVLIDNEEVQGNSVTSQVSESTTFMLQAQGYKGPQNLPAQVVVKEPSVAIPSFTATPPVVFGANNNVQVVLAWETEHAELVLFNEVITEQQSTTEVINQTTTFHLKATGNEGPATKDLTVPVQDPNLVVGQTPDGRMFASFGANPAHYTVTFWYRYPPQNIVDPDTGEQQDYSIARDVQGEGGVVTAYGDPIGAARSVTVTVNGFAGGPLTVPYSPPAPTPRFGPPGDPPPWSPPIGF